ncbi:MAG: DUF5053 domain-containing protein [Bacteroides sp.]|nr:DUF5053 domain-containing protein [Bacteroides sp.]
MELRDKVAVFVDKMLLSGTPDGKKEADAYFAQLNAELSSEEKKEAGRLMRELMDERRLARQAKRTDINVKERLAGIQEMVSLSYIAKHYFGKDRSWLYQRINGSIVNGKPAAFTDQELALFSDALRDIGSKISGASLSIH